MGIKIITDNRKARFSYELIDKMEAGLMLSGSEVKSLRAGGANLMDAYAVIKNGEIFLHSCHIAPYQARHHADHEPTRVRKLLLHKSEINKLIGQIQEKGFTLIPTKMYFKEGIAKVELAIAKNKKNHDKRDTIKKRESDREIGRFLKNAKK